MTPLHRHNDLKPSGAPWLGVVPSHWDVKPLWSMYRPKKETGHPQATLLSVYRDYGVIEKSSRDDNKNRESEDLSGYQLVINGDLVTNKMKTWQGSIAVSSIQGIVSPAYYVYRKLHTGNDAYFHNLFRSLPYITGYNSISKGIRVGQWDLEADKFRLFPVLIPPRQEQDAIVAYLDRATTRIDTLVAKKTRFIELLREKRQALITHAVTKGLDAGVPMKDSGVEWLGEVPDHWDVVRGNAVFVECTEKNDPLVSEDYLSLMANIGVIPYEEKGDVGNKKPEDVRKCKLVEPGDFVLNSMNYAIGSYGVSKYSGVCSPVYVVMKHRPEAADPKFLDLILSNPSYQNYAQSFGTGILDHRRAIGWDEIKVIRVPSPPLNEQADIAAWAISRRDRIDTLIAKTERSIELLREHRTALITAAVTGKIDLRNAA